MFDKNVILSNLRQGEENAISAHALAELCGITERRLRREIFLLRSDGQPIMSSRSGYFFPKTIQEIRTFSRQMRKRAISGFQTRKTAEDLIRFLTDAGCQFGVSDEPQEKRT